VSTPAASLSFCVVKGARRPFHGSAKPASQGRITRKTQAGLYLAFALAPAWPVLVHGTTDTCHCPVKTLSIPAGL